VSPYFLEHRQAYIELCSNVALHATRLFHMQNEVKYNVASWKNVSQAASFVQEAQAWVDAIEPSVKEFQARAQFLQQRISLLDLAILMQQESASACYPLIDAATKGFLTESFARSTQSNSTWPLRSCWLALEERKQRYSALVNALKIYAHESAEAQSYLYHGEEIIRAYTYAQNIVASFTEYTADLRAQKEFELKEEQARIARLQAEAMHKAAEAQVRQAKMQEQEVKQSKEHELIALRTQLSAIKNRINAGNNDYYLRQQRNQIQERIRALKQELGQSSLLNDIVNLLVDRD
jgi:ATP-dependent Lon protease